LTLASDIRAHDVIAVDTNVCIYFLRASSSRFRAVRDVFQAIANGDVEMRVPDVVRMELLVRPYRSGQAAEMNEVHALLARGSRCGLGPSAIDLAARIRAATRLRTADALVVGSAAVGGCTAIVGNDAGFRELNDIIDGGDRIVGGAALPLPRYIHLDDYVGA